MLMTRTCGSTCTSVTTDGGGGGVKKYWPAETGIKQEQGRHGAGDKHD